MMQHHSGMYSPADGREDLEVNVRVVGIFRSKSDGAKKVGYMQAQRPLLFMSELGGFKYKGNINGTDESEITLDVM